MIKRTITLTADGSHTISIPDAGLTYHSHHGAIQESNHIFIKAGLEIALARFPAGELRIFEMGFGTGLNAWLTAQVAENRKRRVFFSSVEKFPLLPHEYAQLNYPAQLGLAPEGFQDLHLAPWNEPVSISRHFILRKTAGSLLEFPAPDAPFHLVYFDAFAPEAQPQLWTETVFFFLKRNMAEGGILTTYCSKGSVRRAMEASGFRVEKIPGPPGKREMVRAFAD